MSEQEVESAFILREIARIEGDLNGRIEAIHQDAARRIVAEVMAVQPALAPLMAYLAATRQEPSSIVTAKARRPRKDSADSLLLRALLEAPTGISRSALDGIIVASGLSEASARKARQTAEGKGWAVRVGQIWSLTAGGRDEALQR